MAPRTKWGRGGRGGGGGGGGEKNNEERKKARESKRKRTMRRKWRITELRELPQNEKFILAVKFYSRQ